MRTGASRGTAASGGAVPDEPTLLHAFLERAAREHPDRMALEIPPGPDRPERVGLTYAQLVTRAGSLAGHLAGQVNRDGIVAVLLDRASPHLLVAQVAILQAGGAYTCIDASFPDAQVRFILEDSGASTLLTDTRGLARLQRAGIDDARILDLDALAERPPPPPPAPPAWLGPECLAYVIYTSGTTGPPKGVLIEHGSIANLVQSDLETFAVRPEDRVAWSSSPAYDSSVEEVWLGLAAGATVVVLDDETVRLGPDLLPWLRQERISVLCPPPTLLRSTGARDPAAELPGLHLLYVGGEPLPEDLARQWGAGRWLENGYGPTECTVTVLRGRIRPEGPVSIGRPIRGNRAYILDAALREVPPGEPGELCIAGAALARGYLGQEGLTAERFPTHPRFGRIFRTGDLVRRDGEGEYHYLGRLDTQVKIRGHRIELGAIEARLAEHPAVREAGCTVQGEGPEQALVAFVTLEWSRRETSPRELQEWLARILPPAMVPGRIHVLDRLPTSTSGKLDRAALRDTTATAALLPPAAAPRSALERCIADAFQEVLGGAGVVSSDQDFFLDLGGDSLRAAMVISRLREEPTTAGLAVRDLYECRTVARLATRVRAAAGPASEVAAIPGACSRGGRPLLVTAVQGVWLLAGSLLGAWILYLLGFLVLPYLVQALGLGGFLLLLPPLALLATLLYLPCALLLAVLAKWLLIGRYQPGRFPIWGSLYLRNWMVQQVVALVPWGFLQDTIFHGAALRVLGARIGRRVHLHRGVALGQGGWDLLTIGDDVTVAQDAALHLVDLEDGELIVGPVTLGAGSTVDVRAGVSAHAEVRPGGYLAPHAWLASGQVLGAGERWDGIPAAPAGQAPEAALPVAGVVLPPGWHGLLVIGGRFLRGFLLYLPLLGLALGAAAVSGLDAGGALTWLFQPTLTLGGLPALCAVVILGTVLAMGLAALLCRLPGRVQPAPVSRWSLSYLRVLTRTDMVRWVGLWLSGTLFWPIWLRLAGMRVGRRCEVSTLIDMVPELIAIGDECFLADGIYLGGPWVHGNVVSVARTSLGPGTFLGNHVVVPAGLELPGDQLLGVCTVAEERMARSGTSWFGHPPLELPRREVVQCDRRLTLEPGSLRYTTRLFWESLRFLLPVVPILLLVVWFRVLAATGTLPGLPYHLLVVPGATLAAAAALLLLVLTLKWLLLGRVQPGQHPLWSCWCSRWDFLYVVWAFLARGILARLEGTLYLPWYLRAMGATVGRRVVLGGGFAQVVDPDLLSFEEYSTMNGLLQAHSFEDRILKLDRVKVERTATVGPGALLFLGVRVGASAHVTPHSVAMKREQLRPGRTYTGSPVREKGTVPFSQE